MKNSYKFATLLFAFFPIVLSSCSYKRTYVVTSATRNLQFDYADLNITTNAFNACGFDFGDSVTIRLHEKDVFKSIPYYDGFYARSGFPVLIGYRDGSGLTIAVTNSGNFWTTYGFEEGDEVEITLVRKGQYRVIQETFEMSYLEDVDDYATHEDFTNFRQINIGSARNNVFYRGCSPVDYDFFNRPSYVDEILKEKGIKYILNLADSKEDFEGHLTNANFKSNYTKSLYDSNMIHFADLKNDFLGDEFKKAVADGFKDFLSHDGPYYIHCTEGINRTGFVSILLESLAGYSYDEMLYDYMKSYDNYFSISEKNTPERYKAIVELRFNDYMVNLSGCYDVPLLKDFDFAFAAKDYLRLGGLTQNEINALTALVEMN